MTASRGRRHRGRELGLSVVFELEGTDKDVESVLSYHVQDLSVPKDIAAFARKLAQGVAEFQEQIDSSLAAASDHWKLDELGKVERAILRIAVYEILYLRETPAPVVINEAVELAKQYAGDQSGQFINGVLGKVLLEPSRQ